MSTFIANAEQATAESKWHVIDANGQVLGRIATVAARMLQGKHKATYTPFIDTGDHIDRFLGYPDLSPAHLSHGGLLTHAILRAGNPYEPGAPTAVLEYRKELVTAEMPARNRTPLVTLPDQYLYYVTGGEGRLDNGTQYWDLHEEGKYLCAACGQELFGSDTKYDSGTGWPSFTRPIAEGRVAVSSDTSLGMVRDEVTCARCAGPSTSSDKPNVW